MPLFNIVSSCGFSTRSLAVVHIAGSRTRGRTADEYNRCDDTVKSTEGADVKRKNYSHALELWSKSEVRGRIVKMKSKSIAQDCADTLSKSAVKFTTCCWIKRIRFFCSSAWPATTQAPRTLQGIEVPFLTTAPTDTAWPNPSLKRSANGRPRRPSSAGASPHFALAVQRVLPSSPA